MKLPVRFLLAALAASPLVFSQVVTSPSSYGTFTAPTAGTREFTLGASGATDRRISGSNGGASGSFGWYFDAENEIVLRQSVNFSTGGETLTTTTPTAGGAVGTGIGVVTTTRSSRREWSAATRLAFDHHFATHGIFRPFLGANFGAVYGRSVRDTLAAGLEAGGKFYVQPRTFILTMVEYGWFFNRARNIDNRFRDGQFTWSAGVGFNF
ncbi:MAG: hypothetical protein ABIQ12_11210 [Opitutaceae bacterium]